MTQPTSLDEAIRFITSLWEQSNAPKLSENSGPITAAGIVVTVDVSALPPGTLIGSHVTGEFFKVAYDHWVTTRQPGVRHSDEDVAAQVQLGWDADLQQSDFNLIHMGE